MKCESVHCERDCCAQIHWPGRSLYVCRACADRARRVAVAMGFRLKVVELGESSGAQS